MPSRCRHVPGRGCICVLRTGRERRAREVNWLYIHRRMGILQTIPSLVPLALGGTRRTEVVSNWGLEQQQPQSSNQAFRIRSDQP